MLQVNQQDLNQVREAMCHWLRQKMPEADAIDIPPLHAPAGGGSSQTIFLSPVIQQDGKRREEHWVLRIQATGHQIYQDPAVERQYLVMLALGQIGEVPVPRVLWYEPDTSILGAPFYVMARVQGQVPDAFYHNAGLFADATAAEREQLWLSAVQALAAIHRTDPSPFQFLAHPALGPTGLEQEIAVWDAYRDWCGVPQTPMQQRARLWLEDHLPSERPTGLAWGDARLPNMLFQHGRCVAVIDWETASLAGAETDLGWWLFFDWYIAEGSGNPRLPGIPDAAEFIRSWEYFAGRKAQNMAWHEVFATWRFSMISRRARLLAGYPLGDGADDPLSRRLAMLMEG